MEWPTRKPNRLSRFDYTQNGAYFITVCTQDRKPILWDVGDGFPVPPSPQNVPLSRMGKIVRRQIGEISEHFPSVTVDRFVIMPDHIHLILFLHRDFGTGNPSPTMGNVVGWLKYQTTKAINGENATTGSRFWQRSFYDHVIRTEQDYVETAQYIANNPARWHERHPL